jgi:hypothetical protein
MPPFLQKTKEINAIRAFETIPGILCTDATKKQPVAKGYRLFSSEAL